MSRRPDGLAPPRGSSFFVGQPELLERRTDRGNGALNAQTLTQFAERGIGLLGDEFGELGAVDLLETLAAHGTGRRLLVLPAALKDPAEPGLADVEGVGDLAGPHPAIKGGKDFVTDIL